MLFQSMNFVVCALAIIDDEIVKEIKIEIRNRRLVFFFHYTWTQASNGVVVE